MSDNSHPKLDADFMRTLDFTMEDLEANRQGRMTERQHKVLEARRSQQQTSCLVLILPFLIIVTFYCWVLSQPNAFEDATFENFLLIFLMLGLPVWVISVPVTRYLGLHSRINDDLSGQKVEFVSGKLMVDLRTRFNGKTYSYSNHLLIDQFEFLVAKDIALRFRHLDHYTIFYAPNSMTILSAEPIDPA